jgi:hypothetical protein
MTPQRAKEVLELGAQWSEYSKHMTPEEVAFVSDGWKRMPGYTCFYDALVRVAQQRHPFAPEHVHTQACYGPEHGQMNCNKEVTQ